MAALTPYSLLIKIGFGLATLAGAGWFGYDYRDKQLAQENLEISAQQIQQLIQQRAEIKILQTQLNNKAADLVLVLDGLEVQTRYITTAVTNEIEKPVYRACFVPASGLQLLREAQDGYNACRRAGGDSCQPPAQVPGVGPSAVWNQP
jgi:hypothetical protein